MIGTYLGYVSDGAHASDFLRVADGISGHIIDISFRAVPYVSCDCIFVKKTLHGMVEGEVDGKEVFVELQMVEKPDTEATEYTLRIDCDCGEEIIEEVANVLAETLDIAGEDFTRVGVII